MPCLDFLGDPFRNVRFSSSYEITAQIRNGEFETVAEEDWIFRLLLTHPYEQIGL